MGQFRNKNNILNYNKHFKMEKNIEKPKKKQKTIFWRLWEGGRQGLFFCFFWFSQVFLFFGPKPKKHLENLKKQNNSHPPQKKLKKP